MRKALAYAHLILLLAMLLVLVWTATAAGAPGPSLADRVLVMELRLEEIRAQHRWLIGLVAADLLSTLALLRRGDR